mmetsp:Transcript_5547/g.9484  ORF Transcript_5547/g.9484 Transcript_5547/m.9484 type:complete len:86 (-) Transcript_5547:28-285(-)
MAGFAIASAMVLATCISEFVFGIIGQQGQKQPTLKFRNKNAGSNQEQEVGEVDEMMIGLDGATGSQEELPDYEYPFDEGIKCNVF